MSELRIILPFNTARCIILMKYQIVIQPHFMTGGFLSSRCSVDYLQFYRTTRLKIFSSDVTQQSQASSVVWYLACDMMVNSLCSCFSCSVTIKSPRSDCSVVMSSHSIHTTIVAKDTKDLLHQLHMHTGLFPSFLKLCFLLEIE